MVAARNWTASSGGCIIRKAVSSHLSGKKRLPDHLRSCHPFPATEGHRRAGKGGALKLQQLIHVHEKSCKTLVAADSFLLVGTQVSVGGGCKKLDSELRWLHHPQSSVFASLRKKALARSSSKLPSLPPLPRALWG